MGRIKSFQPGGNLFSVRYRKLLDENNVTNYSATNNNNNNQSMQNILRMKLAQDYIAYSCGQCGHYQKFDFKAEDLNSIVGSAFRMAYVAQLHSQQQQQQKPGAALVITPQGGDSMRSAKSSHSPLTTSSNVNQSSKSNTSPHSWARQSHDKAQQSKPSSTWSSASSNWSEEDNVSMIAPIEVNKCRSWKSEESKTLMTGQGQSRSALVTSCSPLSLPGSDLANANQCEASCISFQSERRLSNPHLSPSSPLTSDSSAHDSQQTLCMSYQGRSQYPPPLPIRTDSLSSIEEESLLKCAPWFQAGIPREIALEILNHEPIGSFLVRNSTSKPGCFALSLRVPKDFQSTGIAHYLILETHRGYKIKGFTKEFPSLASLIVHHSVMPELLPCPLHLNRHSTNPGFQDSESNDFADIDSDPDYSALSDFRRKMADLNV